MIFLSYKKIVEVRWCQRYLRQKRRRLLGQNEYGVPNRKCCHLFWQNILVNCGKYFMLTDGRDCNVKFILMVKLKKNREAIAKTMCGVPPPPSPFLCVINVLLNGHFYWSLYLLILRKNCMGVFFLAACTRSINTLKRHRCHFTAGPPMSDYNMAASVFPSCFPGHGWMSTAAP